MTLQEYKLKYPPGTYVSYLSYAEFNKSHEGLCVSRVLQNAPNYFEGIEIYPSQMYTYIAYERIQDIVTPETHPEYFL